MIKYCGIELTPEQIKRRRKKARHYFDAMGINPDIKGSMYQERRLDKKPKIHKYFPVGETKNLFAEVQLDCFIFYTHLVVTMIDGDDKWTYYGNAGGVGAPGGLTVAGDIIYTDLETLVSTTTFGVFSGGDGEGGIEVTWGTHGNFVGAGTADCAPFCAGAFGGSGQWYKSNNTNN